MCRRSRPADKNLKSGLVHSTKTKTIPEKDDNMWHHLPSSNLWCYISMTTTCYDDLSAKREYFFDLIGEKHVHWHMVPKISNFFVIEPQMSSCTCRHPFQGFGFRSARCINFGGFVLVVTTGDDDLSMKWTYLPSPNLWWYLPMTTYDDVLSVKRTHFLGFIGEKHVTST